ncbi:MAG: AI-2E family transporter [Bacteroidota bacterium]
MQKYTPYILTVLGIILLAFFVWYFSSIVIYLLIGAVIALIGMPIVRWLSKVKIKDYHLPDSVKAIITLLVIYGILFTLFISFIPVIITQTKNLESINTEAVKESLKEPIAELEAMNRTYQFTDGSQSVEEYFQEKVLSTISSVRFSTIVNDVLGFTGNLFIALFAISFIAFFFLKERDLMYNILLSFIPKEYHEKINVVLEKVKTLLSRYCIGLVLEVLLVGGLIGAGLALLGVKNALAIGIFAGLFNVIPYLGPVIGAALGISLAILSSLQLDFYTQMVPLVLKVGVVFLVVQLIDNFVFQPMIYSSSVKAHPLEIFLVILMASSIAGVPGMILAIPTYTILRVVAKEFFNQFTIVQNITKDI